MSPVISMNSDQVVSLANLEGPILAALSRFEQNNVIKRLWEKDASLWKSDPSHQKVILNRLGWLSSAEWLGKRIGELEAFQKDIQKAGFTHAVLLGMGGSSLAPEVFRQTFGRMRGFPKFSVLDSTNPDQVLQTEKETNLKKTLFIVSSKSGTTLETASFFKYFFNKLRELKGNKAGENFVAITDAGALLEKEASELSLRRTFINPTDVGGRFSVLSYFGMVPAAVIGIPVKKLIERIREEAVLSRSESPADVPAVSLGLLMGVGTKEKKDKLTIIMSSNIYSYGLWIEQMIAESLGKEGKGVVPIFGEDMLAPENYDQDRTFIYLNCGKRNLKTEAKLKQLESAGFPIIRITLKDEFDLGRQFLRWSLATAIAGIEIGVNPFDEPNVQEAKDWTKKFLDELKANGKFLPRPNVYSDSNLDIELSDAAKESRLDSKKPLKTFLNSIRTGDYFDIAAYLPYKSKTEKVFQNIRSILQNSTKKATMFGFGPRYLHSTGQLHKGGPNNCVVILVTAESNGNAKIPGQPFGFKELEYAQALGDFQALGSKGRRAAHIHLKKPVSAAIAKFEKFLIISTD